MRSGQITITTAGTAVQGTDVDGFEFALIASPANSGVVYVGADDTNLDVSATTGYPLKVSDSVVVSTLNLSELWFDAATNGDKVCWLRVK